MLLAPLRVGSWTAFVEFCVLIAEHEPNIDFRVLLSDQQVFLPVGDIPTTLSLDEKWCLILFDEFEIGGVT